MARLTCVPGKTGRTGSAILRIGVSSPLPGSRRHPGSAFCLLFQPLQPLQNGIQIFLHFRAGKPYERHFHQNPLLTGIADPVGQFRKHPDITHQRILICQHRVFS